MTNKPTAMSRAILDGLKLLSYFAVVVGGDALPERKPSRDGVDYILATTDMPRERALLVGDSMVDAATARAAQVAFCGVAWGSRAGDLVAAGIDPIIEHPMQLIHIVDAKGQTSRPR